MYLEQAKVIEKFVSISFLLRDEESDEGREEGVIIAAVQVVDPSVLTVVEEGGVFDLEDFLSVELMNWGEGSTGESFGRWLISGGKIIVIPLPVVTIVTRPHIEMSRLPWRAE